MTKNRLRLFQHITFVLSKQMQLTNQNTFLNTKIYGHEHDEEQSTIGRQFG